MPSIDPEARFRERLRGRIIELDGLRGVAMLWVLIYHAWFMPAGNWFERIAYVAPNLGLIGLEFFFCMSGFLITGILLRYKDSPEYFSGFYGRRLIRILPLYFSYLAVVYFVIPNVGPLTQMLHWFDDPANYRQGELWHWFFLSNYWYAYQGSFEASLLNSTWSLAVEEQFYLIWPCVVLLLARRRMLVFCVAVLILTNIIRAYMILKGYTTVSIYVFTFGRLDAISIGCILAVLASHVKGLMFLQKIRWWLLGIGLAIFIPAIAWTTAFYPKSDDGTQTYARFLADRTFLYYGLLGCAIWSGGLIAHLVVGEHSNFMLRAMRSYSLRFLAKYSYGMYLFHIPAIHLVSNFNSRIWVPWRHEVLGIPLPLPDRPFWRFLFQVESILQVVGLTLFLSLVSWYVLEIHFLKLKVLFPYRRKKAPNGAHGWDE